MSPSLRLLLWLRLRGRFRMALKRINALQSALLTVVVILMGFFAVAGMVIMLLAGRRARGSPLAAGAETWAAPAILVGWVMTVLVGSKVGALAFTPADTDQLFPGPFRRRELVLYRICVQSFGALVSGVFAGLGLIIHAGTMLGGWLAFVMLLLFLQFSNIAMSIAREAGGKRLKALVGTAALMAALYVGVKSGAVRGDWSRVPATLREIRESPVVSTALIPLEPFGRAFAAQDLATALPYVVGCLGLVLLMVALILRLDAVSLEASLAASQKLQAKLERAKSGRTLIRATAGVAVPMPTILGRAAPIAWRQFTGIVRSGAWLLVPLAGVLGAGVGGLEEKLLPVIMPFLMVTVFVLPNLLRFDFRADLDQIDTLKTLPLKSVTIAAGQLIGPVLVIALMVWALLAGVAVREPGRVAALLPAAVLAPLAGAMLMACENILFLLYPYRTAASGVMDVRHMLRGIISQVAKMVLIAAAAAPAGLIVWGLLAMGLGWPVAALVAAGLLIGECVGLVYVLAWAFDRFDPARDLPA